MSRKPPSWAQWRRKQITPGFCEEIAGLIAGGATLKQAGRIIGVPAGVLREWLYTGAEQVYEIYESDILTGPPDLEGMLYTAVENAIGVRGKELVAEIRNAAKDDEWRSRAWLLERLEADEFGDRKQVDVEIGGGSVPIAVEGRAVVGLADVVRLALETGQGHLLGLGDAGGAARGELPAAGDVLPDSAAGDSAARAVPAVAD